jgi:hypothetical protein
MGTSVVVASRFFFAKAWLPLGENSLRDSQSKIVPATQRWGAKNTQSETANQIIQSSGSTIENQKLPID